MLRQFNFRWLFKLMAVAFVVISCDEETDPPAAQPIASFQSQVDAEDPFTVSFTNASQNATSYSWDFGDDSTPSTEENPEHTYAAAGTYQVTLTATGADGATDDKTETVTIVDPNQQAKILTGDTEKTWRLLRDVSTGVLPIVIGSQDRTQTHWSFGGATPLAERPCVLDDDYIFKADGTFSYRTNGNVFADAGPFGPWSDEIGSVCIDSEDENFVGKNGEDLSAWNDGDHEFEYDVEEEKLTVTGLGAFIGLQKVATDAELWVPQESVTYNVVRLVDSEVDTLILEALHGTANYWRFVLVHYDDPADEPDMPTNEPTGEPEEHDLFEDFSGEGAGTTFESPWFTDNIALTLGDENPDANSDFAPGKYVRGAVPGAHISNDVDYKMDLTNRHVFKMKVYLPSSNDYVTEDETAEGWAPTKHLAKTVSIKLQNSENAQPWTDQAEVKHTIEDADLDSWVELTFDFTAVAESVQYDRVLIQIGGEGHKREGTFYLADLELQ